MPSDEFETIAALRTLFARTGTSRDVIAGIGDDAAVIRVGDAALVATVDAQHEGVHFERAWCSLGDVGYRSMVAAASDCIAMGIRPKFALSAVAFEKRDTRAAKMALFRGQNEACGELGIALVGGNLSGANKLSVTTTVFGDANGSKQVRSLSTGQGRVPTILRSGARPGDLVCVLGTIGHARAGLLALQQRRTAKTREHQGVSVWRRPKIDVAWANIVLRSASAAIDISDGLVQDLSHVAKASGVSLDLQASKLFAYAEQTGLVKLAADHKLDWRELLLTSGEDYATVFTAKKAPKGAIVIGTIATGAGVKLDGMKLSRRGFRHF